MPGLCPRPAAANLYLGAAAPVAFCQALSGPVAAGLLAANRIIDDGKLDAFVRKRYSSFDSDIGRRFEDGQLNFEELANLASTFGTSATAKIGQSSGKQEYLENLIMQYVLGVE